MLVNVISKILLLRRKNNYEGIFENEILSRCLKPVPFKGNFALDLESVHEELDMGFAVVSV